MEFVDRSHNNDNDGDDDEDDNDDWNFQWHLHKVALHSLSVIELEFRSAGFCGGRKTVEPGEKFSEQGGEPTTNSTRMI